MKGYILITENIVSDNADSWKEKIEAAFDEKEGIIIDCKGASFFSSAGLRILLSLQKRMEIGKRICLTNVSKDLIEILETTGLISLIDAKPAAKEISLGDLKPFAVGGTGACYKLDDDRILKLYYENTPDEIIEKEKLGAKMALIAGIPTAISYEIVQVGNCKGIIYEMLRAKTLSQQIIAEPQRLEEFGKKYAKIAKQIHETKGDETHFQKWTIPFKEVLDSAQVDENIKSNIDKFLSEMDNYDTYVHGDFNPNNIMLSDGEMMLIDMADFSIGCPVYDVSTVYLTLCYMIEDMQDDEVYDFTGMTCKTQRELWKIFSKEYFKFDNFEEAEKVSSLAKYVKKFAVLKAYFLSLRWPNAFANEKCEKFKKDVEVYFK